MQRAGCRTSASQSMPARLNGNIGEDPMIEPLMNAAPLQPVRSRRGFIFGISALAGGLVLGTPAAFAQAGAQAPTPAAAKPGQPELTAWVVIQSDDSVLIRIARSDMGQGIFTSLPMLVAEELECDWARVQPEYAPVAEHLARKRVWGNMVTTDSVSVRRSQDYLRKAGAQARMMLIRSEEHTSELQSPMYLVCRLLLEKKKKSLV